MKKIWKKFKNLFFRWKDDESLLVKYKDLGLTVGSILMDRHLGKAVGYESLLDRLIKYEAEVVSRGYRSVPIGLFTHFCGEPDELNIPNRDPEENKVFFAKEWRDKYDSDEIFGDFLSRVVLSKEPIVETVSQDNNLFAYEIDLMKGAS